MVDIDELKADAEIALATRQSRRAQKKWIVIGIGLTALILLGGVLQLGKYGDYPPFEVKAVNNSEPLQLSQTGDFIGGWANSVAFVWLLVVTGLQYIALNVQQEELTLTRKELKGTRKEIGEQKELMRRRAAVDFILDARQRLKILLIEAVRERYDDKGRDPVPTFSMRRLINELVRMANESIRTTNEPDCNYTPVRSLADDTKEITQLFDAAVYYQKNLEDDKLYKGFMELKDIAGLYRTCEALQRMADRHGK